MTDYFQKGTADYTSVLTKLKAVGVPCLQIGTTGGDTLAITGERAVPVKQLETKFESWLPAYMAGNMSAV